MRQVLLGQQMVWKRFLLWNLIKRAIFITFNSSRSIMLLQLTFSLFCPADSHSQWSFIVVTELQDSLGPRKDHVVMWLSSLLMLLQFWANGSSTATDKIEVTVSLKLSIWELLKELGECIFMFLNMQGKCETNPWWKCWKFNFMWSDLGHIIILPFHQVLPLLLINFMVIGKLCSWLLWWTRLSL